MLNINYMEERYHLICLIKQKIKKHIKYVTNFSICGNNNGHSLYLHSEYYINNKKFRLIISIILNSIMSREYHYNIILCMNSKQIKIKEKIKNEMNVCYSILELRENYEKIIDYKKELSNHILINIKYNNLFINHIDSIILLKKIKLINYLNLPYEILEIIIIYLF